jgi:hypothetical protein
LRTHTAHADDLTALARTAIRYSRYQHAEALYREAVDGEVLG